MSQDWVLCWLRNAELKLQTWRESDIRYEVFAVMEGHQVLQGVCVHDEETSVVEAHRQGFAIGGEAAATAACAEQGVC